LVHMAATLKYWSLNTVTPFITTSVCMIHRLWRRIIHGTNSVLAVNHDFIRLVFLRKVVYQDAKPFMTLKPNSSVIFFVKDANSV
jgi:hypothetical protein